MNTHISFITFKPPPEGKVCTANQKALGVPNPAPVNRIMGIAHKPCKTGLSVPAIKMDNVCSRQPVPIRTSDPRGYNTGNVPPSYGPEDGKIYGDASHREAEDESATVSKNMRRVPQNEAPAHGFSGGRTAQGTMSRSPEAAAQSGKAYDQETASGNYQVPDKVSTNNGL